MKPAKNIRTCDWTATARKLDQWYGIEGRDLPWRRTRDPYNIWISEVMLQQTQVSRVKTYYERWIRHFPTLEILARADEATVINLWQGLGYYSRGRNLLKAAKQLHDQGYSTLPVEPDVLRQLPGMGPYTVGAICAIAWDMVLPAVDGNVRRIMSRLLDMEEDPSLGVGAQRVAEATESLLRQGRPHRLIQALMDLGSSFCSPRPDCNNCPLATLCLSRRHNTVSQRPATRPRKKPQRREGAALLLRLPYGEVAARQRPALGLWASFWEIPWIVAEENQSAADGLTQLTQNLSGDCSLTVFPKQRTLKFTTWQVRLHLWLGTTSNLPQGCEPFSIERFIKLPMPLGLKELALQALKFHATDERGLP